MDNLMEKIVSLSKRRGFVFAGSEIYGGFANTWDYGPYGVQLKKNIQDFWWKTFVQERRDIAGLDSSILLNPKAWEASGHLGSFTDPLMDCKNCKERIRGDKLIEENLGIEKAAGKSLEEIGKIIKEENLKCPKCGKCDFTEARAFNMMFKTHQGVVAETATEAYLRPETAQGIFINFKNIQQNCRMQIPFGVAQIGKSFRNEITPGNFTYRTREFEQMEIEYFVNPNDKKVIKEKFEEWKEVSKKWFLDLGIKEEMLRFREHEKDELSHYSTMTFDVEYKFPFGWGELMGVAYRGCFDLTQHQEFSGKSMEYTDPQTNEKYIPHVIEPAFGLSRTTLITLLDAYTEDEIEGEPRVVMSFSPRIAPVKAAIFPLMKKPELQKVAKEIFDDLKSDFIIEYDESGAIGKRYRRQDEIGTPYCITVDFDTLEDDTVTLRFRDSAKQIRIKKDELGEALKYLIKENKLELEKNWSLTKNFK